MKSDGRNEMRASRNINQILIPMASYLGHKLRENKNAISGEQNTVSGIKKKTISGKQKNGNSEKKNIENRKNAQETNSYLFLRTGGVRSRILCRDQK